MCPISAQHLLSSLREFVHDGYWLDHGLSGSCTKEMHAVRKLSVWYPVQNTASTRKLKTLFQKYKLELTTGIHVCIDHTFLNIQEIKMPRQLTATKTSHEKWIPIFSVSIMIIPTRITYFVKCKRTLLELNFYQPYPSSWREWILSLLVYVLHRTWNWWQRNIQKSVMHVQVLVLPYQASAYLITHRRCILTLQYIVICQKQNILGANWIAPADSIPNVFSTHR